ncbi:MAG: 3-hydroxyacyl-CoA dehydrogenase NAD-binding domain-containing protein [Chitinophagaceae bacterium]
MTNKAQLANIEVGVVGLGLMGSSIIVTLLMAGHKVKAIAPLASDLEMASTKIIDQLNHCHDAGLIEDPSGLASNVEISEDFKRLQNCQIVFECVIEDIRIKADIYQKITSIVSSSTIIATNTSAIAITTLQELVPNPERFLGIHWAEPAYATRFMEITCGDKTYLEYAEWIFNIAHHWGKEPTLLKKDIRGFITNRLMYAVYRELFQLMAQGRISMEDADKSFRYDAGSWITLMGVFRRMDFTGLKDWAVVLPSIFPTLSNRNTVPEVMQQMVECNARGTQNLKGLYSYSAEEAKEWDHAFALFNKDIFQLASLYPSVKAEVQEEIPVLHPFFE